jgi:hypothetical protein
VSQFKLSFVAAAAAALLTACGGGGSGVESSPTQPRASTSGIAVDGYLSGSTVTCDANANGRADGGEASTTTNGTGGFTFDPGCASPMLITGGTNIDTGFPFVGTLKAPAGSKMVTPLTTLMVVGNLSAADLAAALGLPSNVDVTTMDPADGSNPELFKKTLAVQQVLQQLAKTFSSGDASSTNALYVVAATKLTDALKASNDPTFVGTDGSINIALLQAVASGVATAVNSTLPPQTLAGIVDQVASQAESFLQSDGSLDDLEEVAKRQQAPSLVIDLQAADSFVAFGDAALSLNGQPVSLAQFLSPSGVSVTEFRELGLSLNVVGTPSFKVTSSIAMDLLEDVSTTPRRLQVMIDKVDIEYSSTTGTWTIAPGTDAKVHVYGRMRNGTEVNTILNDLSFNPYAISNNQITLKYEQILDKVFSSAQSAELRTTAGSFKNLTGSFNTTLAISRLNLRSANGTPLPLQDVQIQGSTARVMGVGVKGKVTFN